jgi:hypothetical protein
VTTAPPACHETIARAASLSLNAARASGSTPRKMMSIPPAAPLDNRQTPDGASRAIRGPEIVRSTFLVIAW